jgi:hypothetical protein
MVTAQGAVMESSTASPTSSTSPTTSPTSSATEWAWDLKAKIEGCEPERRCDLVATIFGLRKPSELPRPGEVAQYNLRDWYKLASEFGLVEAGRTTHSYMFRHGLLRFILLTPAGTSGDIRGQMNAMGDFRSSYRGEIANLLVLVDKTMMKAASLGKSFEEFKNDTLTSMNVEKL